MLKKNIPNFLTSCNLFCGCLGITMAFSGELKMAASMIWIAAIFDFLDGFSARLLKVHSEIGKQLDSLADMVTFGVLPACILFKIIQTNSTSTYLPLVVFVVAIFSAVRLAKFNIDDNQSSSFIGLPTPANAILISSLPFLIWEYQFLSENVVVIITVLSLVLSWLLIAPIEMMALKFKDYSWLNNRTRYLFLALSVVFIFAFQILAIPLIILTYILISFISPTRLTNS